MAKTLASDKTCAATTGEGIGDGAIASAKSNPKTTSQDATATTIASPHDLLVASPNDATGPRNAHPAVTACNNGDNSEKDEVPHADEIGPCPSRSGK